MTHADFSITYKFLNTLASYDKKIGKLNSFFVVHIVGTLTAGITTTLDTLCHLAAGVTKLAVGILAAPIFYFTNSCIGEEWAWSAAGKHFLQAANHAIGFFVVVPATFLSSPEAAVNVLFSQRVALEKKKKTPSRLGRLERSNKERKVKSSKSKSRSSNSEDFESSQELKNPKERNSSRQISDHKETPRPDQINEIEEEFIFVTNHLDQVKEKIEILYKNRDSMNSELTTKRDEFEVLRFEFDEMKKTYEKDTLKIQNESKKVVDELVKRNSDLQKEQLAEIKEKRLYQKKFEAISEKFNENEIDYNQKLQSEFNKVNELNKKKLSLEKKLEDEIKECTFYRKDFELLKQNFKVNSMKDIIQQMHALVLENSEMTNKNKEMRLQIAGQMINSEERVNSGISKELVSLIKSLAEELKCPVNTEFMEDAVMLTPCCHRFNENSYPKEHPLTLGVGCNICRVPIKGIYSDPHIRSMSSQIRKIIDLLSKLESKSHSS